MSEEKQKESYELVYIVWRIGGKWKQKEKRRKSKMIIRKKRKVRQREKRDAVIKMEWKSAKGQEYKKKNTCVMRINIQIKRNKVIKCRDKSIVC